HLARGVEAPHHRVTPGHRYARAHRNIFGKARGVGRGEGQPMAQAIGARPPADRTFGCDMDRLRGYGPDPALTLAAGRARTPDARISGHLHRREAVGSEKLDVGPERRGSARE